MYSIIHRIDLESLASYISTLSLCLPASAFELKVKDENFLLVENSETRILYVYPIHYTHYTVHIDITDTYKYIGFLGNIDEPYIIDSLSFPMISLSLSLLGNQQRLLLSWFISQNYFVFYGSVFPLSFSPLSSLLLLFCIILKTRLLGDLISILGIEKDLQEVEGSLNSESDVLLRGLCIMLLS